MKNRNDRPQHPGDSAQIPSSDSHETPLSVSFPNSEVMKKDGKVKSLNPTEVNKKEKVSSFMSSKFDEVDLPNNDKLIKTNQEGENRSSFYWMALPLIIFLIFGFALFVERMGLQFGAANSSLKFLDPVEEEFAEVSLDLQPKCLILYDSEGPDEGLDEGQHHHVIMSTLNDMRVDYDMINVREDGDLNFDRYTNIIVAFVDLNLIEDQVQLLMTWVENGGSVLFSIRPDPSFAFQAIYRKLGIQSKSGNLVAVQGIEFISDLMPSLRDVPFGQELFSHSSIPVRLEDESHLHAISADVYAVPLIWEYELEKGRVVVINSDQFNQKADRGLLSAAYSLLQDVSIYPVINSSVFFLDNFPGPIPLGADENIVQQFGRDIRSFFINIWWPDLQALSQKYHIKYTGLLIEAYNENTTPPFINEGEKETFRYLGRSIQENGGEIGFTGYNQIPLCLVSESDLENNSDRSGWESLTNMTASITEIKNFAALLYPEVQLTTYAPPGGVLCSESLSWLQKAAPGLRVISSSFLPEAGAPSGFHDFVETPDGLIAVPWIISGYQIDEYQRWVAANTLSLYYVNSHIVSPNEILDENVWGEIGWTGLRQRLNDQVMWLYLNAPGLRSMTAKEAAMAVQRYRRLEIRYNNTQDFAQLTLNNFHDEAWLMMRTKRVLESVEGGTYEVVGSGLYLIAAKNPEVTIRFEE